MSWVATSFLTDWSVIGHHVNIWLSGGMGECGVHPQLSTYSTLDYVIQFTDSKIWPYLGHLSIDI